MTPADLHRACECGESATVEESPRGFHTTCWACRWHRYYRWQGAELVAYDPAAGTVGKPLNRKHRKMPAWSGPGEVSAGSEKA